MLIWNATFIIYEGLMRGISLTLLIPGLTNSSFIKDSFVTYFDI